MKNYLLLAPVLGGLLLTACVAYVEPPRVYAPAPAVVVAPLLPPQVILGERPYYHYGGYYYYFQNGIWLYSHSNSGPWYQLPRSHYPSRFQYRGRWYEGEGDWDRDRGQHERD